MRALPASLGRASALLLASVALLGFPARAAAGDGVYGRLDGDLDLSAAAGAAITAQTPVFVARAAVTYVAMAGVFAGYADAFGQSDATIDRSIVAGVTLKPVFWARFANAAELGNARLDLFIDSLVLELGAFWAAPHGRTLAPEPGLEMAAGLGFPLFASANGPFLEVRAALRLGKDDRDGVAANLVERGAMLSLTLAWHQVVPVHIVDAGDRLLR
jgi:hypothetical protein